MGSDNEDRTDISRYFPFAELIPLCQKYPIESDSKERRQSKLSHADGTISEAWTQHSWFSNELLCLPLEDLYGTQTSTGCNCVLYRVVAVEKTDLLERRILLNIQISVERNVSSPAADAAPASPPKSDLYCGLAPGEIRSALDRITSSRTLGNSERLIQFLNFVVEAALNGEHLKETTIGVSVFNCKPDYDPKADAIVRSQAWRLRLKLRVYYASEGAADPLVIDLPKGHYMPAFSLRSNINAERTANYPTRHPHSGST